MTLLLLVLILTLSGCSALLGGRGTGGSGSNGAAGSKPGGADDPVVGGGGGGGVAVPPLHDAVRLEPDPTVVNAHAVAIDHFAIGPDGRTVIVYWWGGNPACYGLQRIDLEVQRGTPVISVLAGTLPAAVDKACTEEAVLTSALVTLDEPILVDAANPDAPAGEPQFLGGGQPVAPRQGVVDARPHAVSGFALTAQGLSLSIYYVGGTEDCYALASATAVRGDDGLLTVEVREGRRPDVDRPCEDIGVSKVVEVTLGEPLIAAAVLDSEPGEPAY
jgi:hypothetical protein